MSLLSKLAAPLVVLAAVGVVLPARAADDPAPPRDAAPAPAPNAAEARQEAGRRFEHAIKLYEEGDYALALAEFERVYELQPDYRVLYNIGQVSIQLGRYARAHRSLSEYLARGGAELPSDRVAAVTADLELLEARTARITVRVSQPGAEISIDGVVVGTSPLPEPLIVDVGERRVQAKLDGYHAQSTVLSLASGDRREAELVLEPEPKPVTEVAPQPVVVAPPPLPRDAVHAARADDSRGPWLWVGWVSTGALATGAILTGVLGISAAGDLETLRDTPGARRSELDRAETRAENWLLAADILGAAAIVTGGATLYFQLSSTPKQGRKAASAPSLEIALAGSKLDLTLRH